MRKLKDCVDRWRYRRYPSCRLPTGHRRAYFFHIRKTAGTAVNQMILAGAAGADAGGAAALWDALWAAHRHRLRIQGRTFVAGEKRLIEEGRYFFASSHLPAHELALPPDTYTFTCLRNPVTRVLSHYRMLLSQQASKDPAFAKEGAWLGAHFAEFLSNIPRQHLLRQVYTFSSTFDPQEALDNIRRCDYWFLMDELPRAAAHLGRTLGLKQLPTLHVNRSEVAAELRPEHRDGLLELLAPEIALYQRVLKLRGVVRKGARRLLPAPAGENGGPGSRYRSPPGAAAGP